MTKKEQLKNWIITYFKSKDAHTKHITQIKEDAGMADLLVEGQKPKAVFIQPELKEIPPSLGRHTVLVTLNTRENLQFVLKNWQELCKNQHLSIYFVNPQSKQEQKWVVFPATHDKITERKTLKKGLESLFATVETVQP